MTRVHCEKLFERAERGPRLANVQGEDVHVLIRAPCGLSQWPPTAAVRCNVYESEAAYGGARLRRETNCLTGVSYKRSFLQVGLPAALRADDGWSRSPVSCISIGIG